MNDWLLTSICLLLITVAWCWVEIGQHNDIGRLGRRLVELEGVVHGR